MTLVMGRFGPLSQPPHICCPKMVFDAGTAAGGALRIQDAQVA
jgi:hypothetical protein